VKSEMLRIETSGNALPFTIVLETDPRNEVSEVWARSRDGMTIVVFFCGVVLFVVFATVSFGLRPLRTLSSAIQSLTRGNYDTRIEENGPKELAALAQSFNHMAERLGALEHQTQRLHSQLLTIQEEERADLARDLHDDVGPFLFTVNVDAAVIADMARGSGQTEIDDRTRAIREAVGHMQRHVKSILGRLRPAGLSEIGLHKAISNLAAFWRQRDQDLTISVDVSDAVGTLEKTLEATAYRVIQESLNNAVRHGCARNINISVKIDDETGAVVVQISDDGVGLNGPQSTGFGLKGMRERVAAMGGQFQLSSGGTRGRGTTVTARFPGAQPVALQVGKMSA
ncbi:MAG: sensor histidine kinase, partial [Rhodospirillaceae bacterium]